MRPEPENFEQLRRLLVLKRYEQPPPGYFDKFSSQVIARIEAGEQAADAMSLGRWLWDGVWLQRVWEALENKPALAGVFGVCVCGLLIVGIVQSDYPTNNRNPGVSISGTTVDDSAPVKPFISPLVAAPAAIEYPSQSGVAALQARTVLFDEISKTEAPAQLPLWKVSGGN